MKLLCGLVAMSIGLALPAGCASPASPSATAPVLGVTTVTPSSSPSRHPLPTPTARPTATRVIQSTATAALPATSPFTVTPLKPAPTARPIQTLAPLPEWQLPPEAIAPTGWPPLPADLYFWRDGCLWRWPASGGEVERLTPPIGGPFELARLTGDGQALIYQTARRLYHLTLHSTEATPHALTPEETEPLWDFSLSPDEQRIAYRTRERKLYLLDRATLARRLLTASAEQYAFTPDGRYLVYLASSSKPISGTLYALDVQALESPIALGSCRNSQMAWGQRPCTGFAVSPDGQHVVYSDGDGLWMTHLLAGKPQLLAANGSGEWGPVIRLGGWSPDSRYVQVKLRYYEGGELAIVDANSGQLCKLPDTPCYVGCSVEHLWGSGELWIATCSDFGIRQVYTAQVTAGELVVTPWFWDTRVQVCPTHLRLLREGRLAFVHQGCVERRGLEAGIYTLSAPGQLELVARLPTRVTDGAEWRWENTWKNQLVWSPNGAAFVFLYDFTPILVGRLDEPVLWDVRDRLRGANGLQWTMPRK